MIPLAYGGTSRFHTSSVANIAVLVRTTLNNPGTRILNVDDPTALSVAEIGAAIAKHLGYRGELVGVDSSGYPPAVGATPWSIPRPFTVSHAASRNAAFGCSCRKCRSVETSCRA
jgi:nucleoside-diphosphate-sugar epimerase